jgi:hypothetical protein
MNQETNVETVRQAYADFIAGNVAGILEKCSEDIAWGSYDNPDVPYAGMFYGKEGVAEFFNRLANGIDYTDFTPKEYFSDDAKNAVFVRGHQAGMAKNTGGTLSHDWLMEFYFKDGKISSFFAFVDTRDQSQAFTAENEKVVRVALTQNNEGSVAHA